MMHVFYNREGVGDTLIITTGDFDENKRTFERKGDAVRIFHSETKEVGGYNIFQASHYVELDTNGQVELTKELVDGLNGALAANGMDDQLEADFTPKFVVGYVQSKEKHPNADKLSICKVDVGNEELQIVCGAPNVDAGQKVVVAKVGAVMPSGMLIKDAELRGVPSSGMICSAKELAIPDAPDKKGILVLEDERYETGQAFSV